MPRFSYRKNVLLQDEANEMSAFLMESELTEIRAFIKSFAKEIGVAPGKAVVRYSIPLSKDSRMPSQDTEEVGLCSPVLNLVGRRGFEPLISALRGRCPGPLDERPTIEGTPEPGPRASSAVETAWRNGRWPACPARSILSNAPVVVNGGQLTMNWPNMVTLWPGKVQTN